ncbi:unnamed protein product [Gordionus sp. m RMFG-2023]
MYYLIYQNYLVKYNYLPPQAIPANRYRGFKSALDTDIERETLVKAIKSFQRFAGIKITGFPDPITLSKMSMPRCGFKDITDGDEDSTNHNEYSNTHKNKSGRYSLEGSKWIKRDLSYRVHKYTLDLASPVIDEEIKKAFDVWEKHADINFYQTSGKADITISFEKGNHGDGDPFDGPGDVLAHAFFPRYGGDVHFDDGETWTNLHHRGTNLYQTAAHEFGHSIGLSHSDKKGSLMAPFYKPSTGKIELHVDDISGIQKLYGFTRVYYPDEKEIFTTTEPILTNDEASREKDICKISGIDAITTNANDETIMFRGKYYWELNDQGVKSGFPRLIKNDWPNIPDNIDAALLGSTSNKIFLFKDNKYWRFSANKTLDTGYPKMINRGFPGLPDNLDAAFIWSGNRMTYFIKGNQYWKYTNSLGKIENGYPKRLSNWVGLPLKIDGAMSWKNGRTYFFSGLDYYRFDDKNFKIDETFPRSAPFWWFGCSSNQYNHPDIRYDDLSAPSNLKQNSPNKLNYKYNKSWGKFIRDDN